MVSETLIGKLSSLNARLAELAALKQFSEMSNPRAFSDGTMAGYDRDMAIVRHDIDMWYATNDLSLTGTDWTLAVSSPDAGRTFEITICKFPSPGVMKQSTVRVARAEAEKIIGFFGGCQVEYINTPMDAVAAFTSIEKRFRSAAEEVGRLRIENRELKAALDLKDKELAARYDDAHS